MKKLETVIPDGFYCSEEEIMTSDDFRGTVEVNYKCPFYKTFEASGLNIPTITGVCNYNCKAIEAHKKTCGINISGYLEDVEVIEDPFNEEEDLSYHKIFPEKLTREQLLDLYLKRQKEKLCTKSIESRIKYFYQNPSWIKKENEKIKKRYIDAYYSD